MPYKDPEKRRAAQRARTLRYIERNPDKHRKWNRKATRHWRLKKHGLTLEAFEAILRAQGGRCAICRIESPAGRGRGGWCIDHDHETKKIRGVLCHNCNVSLGLVGDSVATLAAMIQYLENSRDPEKALDADW